MVEMTHTPKMEQAYELLKAIYNQQQTTFRTVRININGSKKIALFSPSFLSPKDNNEAFKCNSTLTDFRSCTKTVVGACLTPQL